MIEPATMARRSSSSSQRTAATTPCPSRFSRAAQPLPGPLDDPVRTNGDTGRHYEYRPPPHSGRAGVNRAPAATRGPLIDSGCSSPPGQCSSPSSWRRWCRGRSGLGAFAVAVAVDDHHKRTLRGTPPKPDSRVQIERFASFCSGPRFGSRRIVRIVTEEPLRSRIVVGVFSRIPARLGLGSCWGDAAGDRRRERGVRFAWRDRPGSTRRHRSGPRWVSGPAHAGHVASNPPGSDVRSRGKHGDNSGPSALCRRPSHGARCN
jgi:hypothetical protein